MGVLSPSFKPSRGIRQGDPISPYLFLLCSEGLTCLLKSRGPQFISRGIRVSLHAPWISHLLFADDCLIFTQASKRGADRISEILEVYNRGSGQLVNKHKSAVFLVKTVIKLLSRKSSRPSKSLMRLLERSIWDSQPRWGQLLMVRLIMCPKESGALFMVGGDLLSCAGREVLLKSNVQAVPTYPMSCFKLPALACKKMKQYIAKYWWGSSIDSHKIHWQSWSKLTRPKGEGGMGFKDLPLFNQAMLGKQGWRLIMRPDSLCARVLKGKYFPSCSFPEAMRKKKSSETWRAILYGRQALLKGLIKRVGPGTSINIWTDNWIAGSTSLRPLVRRSDVQVDKVSDLFLHDSRMWNEQLVRESFCALDAEEILKLRPG